MTLTLRQTLYAQRLKDHLAHAHSLYASGDYVQTGEKIWGALSALINSRSLVDVKSPNDKKTCFVSLFNAYNNRTPSLFSQMRTLGFRSAEEVFDAIYGLHKFFYGGTNYTPAQLQQRLPFFIDLLDNL